MKKILIINTVGFQYEGITSVILNYINAMDREGLEFVFPVYADIPPALKEELDRLGCTVVVSARKKNVRAYIRELYRLLGERYDVLHVHGNSGTMLIETLLARFRGVKKIILHTHSTSTDHPLANTLMKYPMMLLADMLIACSDAAGKCLYGNHPYIVLNNAIDIERFRFDPEARKRYRQAFGIGEEYLIGHVGHFSPSKNQSFLIDVFEEFHKCEPKSKLLLVGTGSDFEQIREKVDNRNLTDDVVFAGSRSDIASIYSAMDIFVLPSRWEGLPLTTVEAQANGLPVLVSDVVPEETNCTDSVYYKPLSDGIEAWAMCIYEILHTKIDRMSDTHVAIAEKGFDIHKEAEKLQKIYMS